MTTVTEAWQAALAAEHAAVAGYDIVGPRVASAQVAPARADQQAHRDLRDATSAALSAAGQTPVAAQPSYPLPFAVTDAATAGRFAVSLESACAAAWRYLIAVAAATPGRPDVEALRADAQTALTASAVRATRWRLVVDPAEPTVPFPGI
ncbi:MAG TPA: DUF4439 domain-containing protein [Jatrophihabitantaceae bacterium]